jgi:hypothetical protein
MVKSEALLTYGAGDPTCPMRPSAWTARANHLFLFFLVLIVVDNDDPEN